MLNRIADRISKVIEDPKAQGFAAGLAKSLDDNLKNSLNRTNSAIDRYRERQEAREESRMVEYKKNKKDTETAIQNFAGLIKANNLMPEGTTGSVYDFAAQLYKSAGSVEAAGQLYKDLTKTANTIGFSGKDNPLEFVTDVASLNNMTFAETVNQLANRPEKFVMSDSKKIMGQGLLARADITSKVKQAISEVTSDIPEQDTDMTIPAAKIDRSKMLDAVTYKKEDELRKAQLANLVNRTKLNKAQIDKIYKEIDDYGRLDLSGFKSINKDIYTRYMKGKGFNLDGDGNLKFTDGADRGEYAQKFQAYARNVFRFYPFGIKDKPLVNNAYKASIQSVFGDLSVATGTDSDREAHAGNHFKPIFIDTKRDADGRVVSEELITQQGEGYAVGQIYFRPDTGRAFVYTGEKDFNKQVLLDSKFILEESPVYDNITFKRPQDNKIVTIKGFTPLSR